MQDKYRGWAGVGGCCSSSLFNTGVQLTLYNGQWGVLKTKQNHHEKKNHNRHKRHNLRVITVPCASAELESREIDSSVRPTMDIATAILTTVPHAMPHSAQHQHHLTNTHETPSHSVASNQQHTQSAKHVHDSTTVAANQASSIHSTPNIS